MRSNGMTWWDVVVGLLLAVLVGSLAIAEVTSSEEIANRVRCSSNLREIGQAMVLYGQDYRGSFPRTIADPNKPKPVWGTPYQGNDRLGAEEAAKVNPFDATKSDVVPNANDVTAAFFLLVRTQDLNSQAFVCPSTGSENWNYGGWTHTPLEWSNFPGDKVLAEHLSYSLQNPYPTTDAIARRFIWNTGLGAEYAVAADMNPGVDGLLKLNPKSSPTELRRGNSPNHWGAGQNILYADGHVTYEPSPFAGVNLDNIFTYGNSGNSVRDRGGDGIVGSPVSSEDSVLLPTAKDLGIVDADGNLSAAAKKRREALPADWTPPTAVQKAAAQKMLEGNYSMQQGDRTIKLQISDKQMIASSGPIIIAYRYFINGIGDDLTRVNLAEREKPVLHLTIKMQPMGIAVKGSSYFEGKWTRE